MTRYTVIGKQSWGYILWLISVLILVFIGLYAAHYMDVEGHHVTGMNNRVVWGIPHVFAIFLIVTASGALNVASIASVFGQQAYKPLSRLSGLLATALLVGGLFILVLDLGRPERLIVAMMTYNFKSIFAWNIFLYTGFIVLVIVYLWLLFERRFNKYSKPVGVVAFIWRIILTTGTGSIFGFLVARQAYDAALLAPLFVAMSLAFGTAAFIIGLMALYRCTNRLLDGEYLLRLGKLLGIFVAAVLYLTLAYHLTNLYATEHHGVERFILLEGGIYTTLFWLGQIILGCLVPLLVLFLLRSKLGIHKSVVLGAIFVLIGAFAQLYVIIVAGQAYPLSLFPGMEITSGFLDTGIATYVPSLPEYLLGMGGIAIALVVVSVGVRVLPFMPEQLRFAK